MSVTPLLPDAKMRELGFTDHREGYWYYNAPLGNNITFDVTINKVTGEWTEDVLDEDFLQPYHYGRYDNPVVKGVRVAVDEQVAFLADHGITVAVDHREYGAIA